MEIKQELRADQENVANISQDSILESQYVTTVSKYEGHRGEMEAEITAEKWEILLIALAEDKLLMKSPPMPPKLLMKPIRPILDKFNRNTCKLNDEKTFCINDIESYISKLNNEKTIEEAKKLFSTGFRHLIEKDEEKAFKYFMNSADLKHADGTFMVGYCFQHGAGVIRNERKAFEYYLKASELGHTKGTLRAGYCYRHGIGVDKNETKALENYKKIKGKLLQIPYNEFKNIKKIGQGGFSVVYQATWKNQNVALKSFLKKNDDFTNELIAYYASNVNLKCYGISKDDSGNDILVLKYAEMGSLSKNISAISKMEWKKKLKLLLDITSDLEALHYENFIHRDLHSGNILQDNLENAYIADLGFSTSSNKKNIYGVLPYVAPEVLQGNLHTQASDI